MGSVLLRFGLLFSFIGSVLLAASFLRPDVERTLARAWRFPFEFLIGARSAARAQPLLAGWFFFSMAAGSVIGFLIALSELPFNNAAPELTETQARIQFSIAFWIGLPLFLACAYFLVRQDGRHPVRRLLLFVPGMWGLLVGILYFWLGLALLAVCMGLLGIGWFVARNLARRVGLEESAPAVGAIVVAIGSLLQLVDALLN